MFVIGADKKLTITYPQKLLTKNKKYNYKEVTIPSDLYQLWTHQLGVAPKEVTLVTPETSDPVTFIVLQKDITHEDFRKLCETVGRPATEIFNQCTLKIRINKSKPNKEGKQKQKATMSINKCITINSQNITFVVDPCKPSLLGSYGLTTVEGLCVH
jgi:hypothetical protein